MTELLHRSYGFDLSTCGAINEEERSLEVIASTDTEDSYEEIVEQDWDLKRYAKNPVVLYEHNRATGGFFSSGGQATDKIPIGRAESVRIESGKLKAKLIFAPAEVSEIAERVWQAVRGQFMRAVSVGFRSKNVRYEKRNGREVYVLSDNELYEISVVAIPANPDAIAEEKAKSLEQLRRLAYSQLAAPKAGAHGTEKTMSFLLLAAKMLGCEATEAAVIAAIEKTKAVSEPVLLEGKAFTWPVVLSALSLADDATEADAVKAINVLVAKSAKAEEIEPKYTELAKDLDARKSADAEREVNWLVKHGKHYGVAANDKSKKALLAYRKSDPASFAEEFAVALKGLTEFDKAADFVAQTKAGGALATDTESSAARVRADDDGANDELEAEVAKVVDEHAKKGVPVSAIQARKLAYERLSQRGA